MPQQHTRRRRITSGTINTGALIPLPVTADCASLSVVMSGIGGGGGGGGGGDGSGNGTTGGGDGCGGEGGGGDGASTAVDVQLIVLTLSIKTLSWLPKREGFRAATRVASHLIVRVGMEGKRTCA